MRLTRAGDYAIRCISYLSKKGMGVSVPKQEIAEQGKIPPSFLAKIAQDLSKGGLIEIQQGSKGGYRLLKEPGDITLLEVVEIIIGKIYLNHCVGGPVGCPLRPCCLIHQVWDNASEQLRANLSNANFAQLSQEKYCPPRVPVPGGQGSTKT